MSNCDVYWGSHGCHLDRGHEGAHLCCCECKAHPDPDSGCVGAFPYYGALTRFYGDDAETALEVCRQCPVIEECTEWTRRDRRMLSFMSGVLAGRVFAARDRTHLAHGMPLPPPRTANGAR